MNNWNFTGNLGQDADQRYTPNGDSVVSFSVGVKSGFGDKATTTWARCSMFGKRGESVLSFLNKGQLVGVNGELTAREWTDREGLKRTSIEVHVADLTLLGKRDDNQAKEPAPQRQQPRPAAPQAGPGGSIADLDSDIPFAPMYGRKAHYI